MKNYQQFQIITRLSILCVTHQIISHKKRNWDSMGRYWLVLGGTGSVWGGTGWYMVVLGQYNSVLLSIKLYLVNKMLF